MKSIYHQIEIPEETKATSITEKEAQFIFDFLIEKKINKTLEVGFAYGCSGSHILSATKDTHYAIDPFQDAYQNLGLKNIETLGLSEHLHFMREYSHSALPKLFEQGVKVNFAFIDGGHRFDDIFIDFYYVDLMLNQNGYVLLHDSWMRSTRWAASWIKNNKKNYKRIKTPINNLIMFQKVGEDNRTWYHFKGFATLKSYLNQIYFEMRHVER